MRPRRRYYRALCCFLGVLAIACSPQAQRTASDVPADRLSVRTPRDRYADDLGRFLAGLPARPGSPFAELESHPAWVEHRRALDRAWDKIFEASLPAMQAFQKRELSTWSIVRAPVFYPFSGPDALMVTVFFPRNPTYVMVGLEPAGTLPKARQIERKNLESRLAAVRTTLASELGRSFFITRQMDRQFRGQVTDGLFLPILELLVRSNHTILGYHYVRLDEAANIVERPADYTAPGRIGNKGVEIDFRSDDDRSIHKLLYFSVNLSDESLNENRPFLAFVASLKGTASMLKATSYMMHKPEFSTIREILLSQSLAVLQDDSGIPYHCFARSTWKVQLYGSYDRPYGSFRWLQQPDLREAYQSPATKPLNFRIGYGYGKAPSNLLLAHKVD